MNLKNCLIIAEAGVNHNGQLDLALKLCDAAKNAGADVVKFQTWKTEKLITRNVDQAEYQAKNTGKQETQTKKLPVILSTGMSTLGDVENSIYALKEGGATDITVLHCTTNYPCPYPDVNLKAMLTLRDAFHLPVGYSDHTKGLEVSVAAATLGAAIIEKHFTLDCKMQGPDHAASTEPEEFAELVKAVRNVEVCLGTGLKEPTPAERKISKVVTKRIVARQLIKVGDVFTENNICVKRNDKGVLAKQWDMVVGKKALKDYQIDDGIYC